MLIFPAIDIYEGQAVRLYKGDYNALTVYSPRPWEVAQAFRDAGAACMHVVDLEGARNGGTPNLELILRLREAGGLFTEVGGGIRTLETVERYLTAGIDRVILGTAAVTDEQFLCGAVERFGARIAVGVDLRDGYAAIKGWTERTSLRAEMFLRRLVGLGVRTVICTDISRDGALKGTNRELYAQLQAEFGNGLNIIASGGVSNIDDVRALKALGLYGAIVGKAYYTGALDLAEAIRAASEEVTA